MANVDRVTVTLPNDLVRDIDRLDKNRSKFIAEAVRNELDRRRREKIGDFANGFVERGIVGGHGGLLG